MPTTVLLVDDHRILRDGLRALLQAQPDLVVVAEAEDGRTAVRLAGEAAPDVAVMDIAMPGLNGIDATRQIRAVSPRTRVVALSVYTDARMVGEALRAGVSAYLPKAGSFDELVLAVRTVTAGKVYLSPHVAHVVVDDYTAPRPADGDGNGSGGGTPRAGPSVFTRLSPREREVLQLLAEGNATKEVARRLSVSAKTVETHRRQIMQKLDLHSVAELTKYAVREGLTTLDT